MPTFGATGADMYICQVCGYDLDSGQLPPVWRPDITGMQSAGNVCPACLKKHEGKGLKWRVEIEWACQERRQDNPNLKSLMDCIRIVKRWGHLTNEQLAKEGTHVLLTIDEMVEVEVMFKTGLRLSA